MANPMTKTPHYGDLSQSAKNLLDGMIANYSDMTSSELTDALCIHPDYMQGHKIPHAVREELMDFAYGVRRLGEMWGTTI